jgi:PST family polysaccharide transporter
MEFLRSNSRAAGSYFGCAWVHYLLSNVDTAVIGRLFGPLQLGYYQTAFVLPEELRSRLALSLQRVVFPAYALVQSDHATFRDGVLKSLRLLATATIPAGAGMLILADPIVRSLYGDQWLPVVPLLRITAVIGVVRAFQALLSNIYFAKGQPQVNFKVSLVLMPLFIVGVLVGSRGGAAGVALGVLVFSVALLVSSYLALRLIDLGWTKAVGALAPATAASALMTGGLLLFGAMRAEAHSSALLELSLNVAIGVVLFFAALIALSRETLNDLRAVGHLLRAKTTAPATASSISARRS